MLLCKGRTRGPSGSHCEAQRAPRQECEGLGQTAKVAAGRHWGQGMGPRGGGRLAVSMSVDVWLHYGRFK